jgi:hypothetical protein
LLAAALAEETLRSRGTIGDQRQSASVGDETLTKRLLVLRQKMPTIEPWHRPTSQRPGAANVNVRIESTDEEEAEDVHRWRKGRHWHWQQPAMR